MVIKKIRGQKFGMISFNQTENGPMIFCVDLSARKTKHLRKELCCAGWEGVGSNRKITGHWCLKKRERICNQ